MEQGLVTIKKKNSPPPHTHTHTHTQKINGRCLSIKLHSVQICSPIIPID